MRLSLAISIVFLLSTDIHAAHQKLVVGDACEIQRPFKVSANAGGKGKKTKLPKGTRLELLSENKYWIEVAGGENRGFVKLQLLNQRCIKVEKAAEPEADEPVDAETGDKTPPSSDAVPEAPAAPPPAPEHAPSEAEPEAPAAPSAPPAVDASPGADAPANETEPPTGTTDPTAESPAEPEPEESGGDSIAATDVDVDVTTKDETATVETIVAPPPEQGDGLTRTLAWVAIGTGAAGLISGTGLIIVGQIERKRWRDSTNAYNQAGAVDPNVYNDLVRRRSELGKWTTFAIIGWSVGAVAGGVGTWLYLISGDPGPTEASPGTSVAADATSAGPSWTVGASPGMLLLGGSF